MSQEDVLYKEDVEKSAEKYFNYSVISSIVTFILFSSAVWFGSSIFMHSMTSGSILTLVLLTAGTCVSFAVLNSNTSYYGLYKSELNSLERNM